MRFEEIPISDAIQHEFKNPVDVSLYKNGLMSKVGVGTIHNTGRKLIANMEIDNNGISGNFDIQLFLAGNQIISILLCP